MSAYEAADGVAFYARTNDNSASVADGCFIVHETLPLRPAVEDVEMSLRLHRGHRFDGGRKLGTRVRVDRVRKGKQVLAPLSFRHFSFPPFAVSSSR